MSPVQPPESVLSPRVVAAAAGLRHGGEGKLTLARALPSSSFPHMTNLFQAKEVILGLKPHLDPSQAPFPAAAPPKGTEGPAPAWRGGGQGAHEQPVLDNPG